MTRALIRALEFMGWWIERFMGWFKGYARRRNMGSPERSVFLAFQLEQSLALKLDDPGDAAQVAALIWDKVRVQLFLPKSEATLAFPSEQQGPDMSNSCAT